ncbi:hypothetical protein ACUWN6_003756 [Vibrio alginolyticus]
MKQFLGDGQEMGTPQGTPTKIKPTNTIKNHILKMQIQITPATKRLEKATLGWSFLYQQPTIRIVFFSHALMLPDNFSRALLHNSERTPI